MAIYDIFLNFHFLFVSILQFLVKSQNLITYKCIISVVISGEGIEST